MEGRERGRVGEWQKSREGMKGREVEMILGRRIWGCLNEVLLMAVVEMRRGLR